MRTRIAARATLAVLLALFAFTMPACQTTTRKAQPEMLSGETETPHERHATGLKSHVNY